MPGADQTDRAALTALPDRADQTDRAALEHLDRLPAVRECGEILVIDDVTGALTATGLETGRVVAWQTSRRAAEALAERFPQAIEAGRLVVAGLDPVGPVPLEEVAWASTAETALVRLPKALLALDHRARALARAAAARDIGFSLLASGRVKHMTRRQNEVLAAAFTQVEAQRGVGKSRALLATGPRKDLEQPPVMAGQAQVTVRGAAETIPLCGVGGVFGGAAADAGSLLLLASLDEVVRGGELDAVETAGDLGCGNGLLTAYLLRALPQARVVAADDDADAIDSTGRTLESVWRPEFRDRVELRWEPSFRGVPDQSLDLVLLNPPFHDGPGVDPTLVQGLLDAAARVLRPGGRLWMVHNSHLRYRPEVERRVGPVRQRVRDRRFTVLEAVSRPGPAAQR
ncbi:methyltransferase [Brachybacterium sp. EF45031]|nr:methyltransferase [Brachybacterium sillae]